MDSRTYVLNRTYCVLACGFDSRASREVIVRFDILEHIKHLDWSQADGSSEQKRNKPVLLGSGATLEAFTGCLKRASEKLRRKQTEPETWGINIS